MIFVTVGTGSFDGLVRRMDELAPTLTDEVVCQIGMGAYCPKNFQYFCFAPSLDDYMRSARLVVGHGGLGTIMGAVRMGRPFVGVSNPNRLDLHQEQILSTFEARGYAIWCRSLDDLPECIERALQVPPRPYTEPACLIPDVIRKFLLDERPSREATHLLPSLAASSTTTNVIARAASLCQRFPRVDGRGILNRARLRTPRHRMERAGEPSQSHQHQGKSRP